MNSFAIALLLPSSWTVIGAPLGNHLWQSTVFAGAIWLLTLLLRKNHAQSRYVLWLIASAKFLIPFSVLIGMGSHLPWSRTPVVTQHGAFLAMETLSEPFAPVNPTRVAPLAAPNAMEIAARYLPAFLLALWSIGCAAVLLVWYLRWRGLTVTRRAALPLQSGRELEALRRMEQTVRSSHQIDLLLSKSALEPGILGIFQPALLLPAGISDKLTDAQLESVIAHELCHVRRHDNLAAALHMLVEALFWFHPLVWWIGARLVDERERACDEEVLRLGADPHIYAEGILKICKFYLESPQLCAAGVTGSNLKKRIEAIMSNRISPNLDFSRKLLLSAAGFAAVIVPIAFGFIRPTKSLAESQAQDTLPPVPAFESAMIRPNNGEPMAGFTIVGKPFKAIMWKGDRFMATNFTLHGLIRVAYGVPGDQILGGPDWLNTEGYDLDAKMGKSVVDEMQTRGRRYGVSGRTLMLQKLLSDRFKLSFHRETRDIPVYALTVAANSSKLRPAKPGDTYANGLKKPDGSPIGANILSAEEGKLVGQGIPIARLVEDLSAEYYLHRTVLDKTGLTDKYDFTLQWTPDESQPAILAAVQEQLGLKLEQQTAPVEVLVIDHAEKPAESQAHDAPSALPAFENASVKPNKSGNSMRAQSTSSTAPAFELASITPSGPGNEGTSVRFAPGKLTLVNWTTGSLIGYAYNVGPPREISGGPSWMDSQKYNIDLKVNDSLAYKSGKLIETNVAGRFPPGLRHDQLMLMIQSLLADRFKLRLTRKIEQVPVYALVVSNNGSKLQAAKPGDTYNNGIIDPDGRPVGPHRGTGQKGHLTVQALPLANIVQLLSLQLAVARTLLWIKPDLQENMISLWIGLRTRAKVGGTDPRSSQQSRNSLGSN